MRSWRSRGSTTQPDPEAVAAKKRAEEALDETRTFAHEARQVSSSLPDLRMKDYFGETLVQLIRDGKAG